MFIGRENELHTLDKLYHSDKFEFAVIYGRRRVGKTALISEFAKNKDTIFFTGVETNASGRTKRLTSVFLKSLQSVATYLAIRKNTFTSLPKPALRKVVWIEQMDWVM